jgi:eukaryotic-like serine/threonine-protein kinase
VGSGAVSAIVDAGSGVERRVLEVPEFGELAPISRFGGQGRVYRPAVVPAGLGSEPVVVKLYRRAPPAGAGHVLSEMVAWGHLLADDQRAALQRRGAWPLAIVRSGGAAAGIVMRDVRGRFSAPFVMPSGRRENVLLTLEHLLGADNFLQLRGLGVRLDTFSRAEVAERICDALAFLHRHAIVASDIAPNNVLIAFGAGDEPEVCLIDCDSMVFHGRQALTPVQTGDWELPAAYAESPNTRAADGYKLGLVVLRLFARSHDARAADPYLQCVPAELRGLMGRALDADAVNRPPAGEWQRALRGLLADGRLNERYPGPAPTPRVVVRRASPAPDPVPAVVAAPALQPNGALWLKRAVAVAWIVAGTAVLLLLLSRLFASAVPVPDGGNAGAVSQSQFGPGANSPYIYQYGYPRQRSFLPGYAVGGQVP